MKNSPPAVAGGLFFVCRNGAFRAPWRRVHDLSPTGIISRLRAQDGAFRAPARVPFFFCKKKGTKENHLDLRSKDPLARCGSCRFGGMHSRMKCGGGRCRFGGSLVPLAPLPLTAVRVGAGALIVFGDYQIAPLPTHVGKGRCARWARSIIIP